MGLLLVVGDLHLTEFSPKKEQVLDFLNWFFQNKDFNNSNNTLLLLGDLVETIDAPTELLSIFIDYFLNISKFKKIYILTGNHDRNIYTSILSAFRPLHNVEIIEKEIIKDIEGLNCLLLPYYNHEGTSLEPMKDNYSKLSGSYDYIFTHVEDETNHFTEDYCNLSKLSGVFMAGHIHTATIQNGGHFLGAPILNSKSESQKTPYIASIDFFTKKYELIEVPKTLEYYEINYPELLPTLTTKYGLFTINNSLDKQETIEHYSKEALNKNFVFYPLRINPKQIKQEVDLSRADYHEQTEIELFNTYEKLFSIEQEIVLLCKKVIQKKVARETI